MKRPKPYALTTHDGKRVDWRTKEALMRAEKLLGYELSITQGSYNRGGVAASGGTHDGGGVVDLAEWDWKRKVKALRRVGFAAYHRPELWRGGKRVWPGHIHAVQVGNKNLSNAAKNQVRDFYAGLDALASRGPDPHKGMTFRVRAWPYHGVVGAARWRRDQLKGAQRTNYLKRLRKVVRGT